MLLVGDSMIAGAFGLYMARDLERRYGYRLERDGHSSTGLARPDFFDWEEEGAKQVEAFDPDAVLCMFGGNDGQGLYMGRDADPKWIRYGEDDWTPEYERRIRAFADAVTPRGQTLFWMGMPVMGIEKLNGRVEHMNGLFADEMERRSNGYFLDIWDLLRTEDGDYAEHLTIDGKRTRVRANDGVHLSGPGARLLVDTLVPQIHGILG